MKKINLFLLFTFFTLVAFGQNELSFDITKAEYKSDEQYLKIDLIVKNNTDSIVFFIRPKNYFFEPRLMYYLRLHHCRTLNYHYPIQTSPILLAYALGCYAPSRVDSQHHVYDPQCA